MVMIIPSITPIIKSVSHEPCKATPGTNLVASQSPPVPAIMESKITFNIIGILSFSAKQVNPVVIPQLRDYYRVNFFLERIVFSFANFCGKLLRIDALHRVCAI